MEDTDTCRICGEPIHWQESRVIAFGLHSQAHHRCYWAERQRLEALPATGKDEP